MDKVQHSSDDMEGMVFLEEKVKSIETLGRRERYLMAYKSLTEDDKIKEGKSLIGKIFTDRHISKVTIGGVMGKI